MSITGKNSKSIRKKDVKESKSLSNGFTKLVFAHKATAGETGIDTGSLVTPSEMSSLGFTNPSASRLLEARMFQFKNNLKVISSLKGELMPSLSYVVSSNSRISFIGFSAEDGEIFTCVLDSNPISGIQVIDAKTPVSEGDLLDGNTDFAIGFATKTNSDDIQVYRNGLVQKRNSNNSNTVLDGNYRVVDSGSGFGNVIRFNTAASGSNDYIRVTAIGGVVETPTNSTWDEIEKVQGQVDAMIPTLADLAGVDETDFQSAPNNVDLKQFGDIVNGLLDKEIPIHEDWQTFTLVPSSGSLATNRSVDIAKWRRIGSVAEIFIQLTWTDTTGASNGSGDITFALPTELQSLTPVPAGSATGLGIGNSITMRTSTALYNGVSALLGGELWGTNFCRTDGNATANANQNSAIMPFVDNQFRYSAKWVIEFQEWEETQSLKEHLESKGIL